MLTLGITGTIYAAVEPVDDCKGIDGLSGVVRTVLGRDPASGDLFIFKNPRGDRWQKKLRQRRLEAIFSTTISRSDMKLSSP